MFMDISVDATIFILNRCLMLSDISPSVCNTLSAATRAKLQALQDFDLSEITNAFTDDDHVAGKIFSKEQIYPIKLYFGKADLEIARRLEKEFKRFIALTLIQPEVLQAPSGPVDMYWHFFMLNTLFYQEFCDKVLGTS